MQSRPRSSPLSSFRLCLVHLGALVALSGCHCADAFAVNTDARLVVGESNFEVIFGEGHGSPAVYVELGDCSGAEVIILDEQEQDIDPVTCRAGGFYAFDFDGDRFENSLVLLRVRSMDERDTTLRVVSPGVDDLDDCSELDVESVRQVD